MFENEQLLVQRFVVGTGQWEGVHSHAGNQLRINISGGNVSQRRGGVEVQSSTFSTEGAVEWIDTIPLSEEYEARNTGDSDIDLVWVTLK